MAGGTNSYTGIGAGWSDISCASAWSSPCTRYSSRGDARATSGPEGHGRTRDFLGGGRNREGAGEAPHPGRRPL